MKLEDNIRKIIMQIPSYEGVDPSLKLAAESGIKPENIIKLNANENQEAVDFDVYYIVTDKCTECIGFHEEPQCAAVCPVDCCIPDEDNVEKEEELLQKKNFLHS